MPPLDKSMEILPARAQAPKRFKINVLSFFMMYRKIQLLSLRSYKQCYSHHEHIIEHADLAVSRELLTHAVDHGKIPLNANTKRSCDE